MDETGYKYSITYKYIYINIIIRIYKTMIYIYILYIFVFVCESHPYEQLSNLTAKLANTNPNCWPITVRKGRRHPTATTINVEPSTYKVCSKTMKDILEL